MLSRETIENYFLHLQDEICKGLENADGKGKFQEDVWVRPEGGGGKTRIIKGGNVIEKGGVNFSAVFGPCPDFLKKEAGIPLAPPGGLGADNPQFYAAGVSLVIHPVNPMVPIIHTNVRYLEAGIPFAPSRGLGAKWFGGGIDLTPHYLNEEDARFFHQSLKKVCDTYSPQPPKGGEEDYYTEFKKWADDYFFITHRNETRGIGGVFFDRLAETDSISIEERFNFVKGVGNSFLPVYLPLIEKNRNKPFTEANRAWQLLRRGRYVEFNLVYDRGTKFGLLTNGRTESILMSLPPTANWEYAQNPIPGSPEYDTLANLKKGIDWAGGT